MAEQPHWPSDVQRLRLGDIEIDLRYRTVRRGDSSYELNPRCFGLLLLFLREPGVLQTRETIFRKVWCGAVVEDASLTNCIWLMRRAFGRTAKQWIRTVPKQGYVFDPPASAHAVVCPPEAPAESESVAAILPDPAAVAAACEVAPVPAIAAHTARRRPLLWAAAAIAATVALGGAALLRADSVASTHRRVALIAATGAELPDDARWATPLLQAWLEWQLRSFPELTVAAATDACRDCGELAIVLGVEMAPGGDVPWRVSARFRGSSPPPDVMRASSADALVATLDAVGRDVLAAVVPSQDAASYPALALDAATAAEFAQGWVAEQRHRWSDAARAYTTVVDKAPAFGYARVRLAQTLDELGQQGAAQAELTRAAAWIDALPRPLRAPVDAQRSLILHDDAAAARAFAALAHAGGDVAYRLGQASALKRLGRTRDAAQLLAGEPPAQPAPALRWLMQRADVEIANRDMARAAKSAQAAIDVAAKLGWERERAQATLLYVEAQADNGRPLDAALFDAAVRAFDAAGDKLGALRTRVYADLYGPRGNDAPRRLDELLAEARLAGNPGVEIEALRRTALYLDETGDTDRARERFAQAAAVAESSGRAYERRVIDLHLLHEDTLRLDFAAVDRRLARLRAEPLQGRAAYSVGLNAARLDYLRGHYDAALATLADAERALRAGDNLPQIALANGCLRGSIHLMQGRTSASRNDIRECRASGQPVLDQLADIASAELAIHAGDLGEARRLLMPMRKQVRDLANRQHRWNLAIEIAPLLARVGELDAARELVDDVLPEVTRAQYRLLVANARVTRAEIALALGRTDEAKRDAATAAALVPDDDWYERRRIRTIDALIARARGDAQGAARELESLHADALDRGDVLAELLVHSVMDPGTLAGGCSDRRHAQLLAESGMRGASDIWMNPAAHASGAALANAHAKDP
ncbi:winged helix-turn-helix domain-containing protein [Tahibacter soli]|uniref:Winged helix-turn-helix domain-containing protein n=1 Tax=Tahibacter soli TaxID=2983605 RepID=A0A9X3YJ03_9GAMM|nr:winged helix-turn-helix domain-containing protein [Tahibacter soli]MDC8012424.1 winged helix-turn-helix domain-containing protein [Tahibacter soli]